MPNPFVVLEGLSGVGKTSAGKLLASRLGGIFYHTPPVPLDQVRKAIDDSGSPGARYLFYLSSVAYASREIAELRRSTPVVCDRYILTTQCYFRALGLPVIETDFLRLEQPDLTVLLTCQDRDRFHRLDERGRNQNDLEEERGSLYLRFEAEYRRHGLLEIDTAGKTLEEVVCLILGHLENLYPGATLIRQPAEVR